MPVSIAMRDEDYPAFDLTPDANSDLVYGDGVRIGYRGLAASGLIPRHALGSGFGYAEFELSDVVIGSDGHGGFVAQVTVWNRSGRSGSEVVQVYRDSPELTLIGFAKVTLAPGASQRVSIPVERRRFMTWRNGWVPIAGHVRIRLGRASDDTPFEMTVQLL